jgi:hypothetical protein
MLIKLKDLESSIATWIYSDISDDYVLFSCVSRDKQNKVFLCFDKIEYKSKTYYKILYNNKIININSFDIKEEII